MKSVQNITLIFFGKGFNREERADISDATYLKRLNENDFFMFNGDYSINTDYVYLKILNKQAVFANLYNIKKGISMCFANMIADHDKIAIMNFPYNGYKNFFVSPLSASNMYKATKDLKRFKKSADVVKLYSQVNPEDNPVLMYYSFKLDPKI